jgi:hypothetical protein
MNKKIEKILKQIATNGHAVLDFNSIKERNSYEKTLKTFEEIGFNILQHDDFLFEIQTQK